jgi:hypothetical protein
VQTWPLPQEEGWEVVSNKPKERAPASGGGDWTQVWGTPPPSSSSSSSISKESKSEKIKREADKALKTTQTKNVRRKNKKDAVIEAQRQALRDRS